MIRLTLKQAAQLGIDVPKTSPESKYHNQRTTFKNEKFDSQAEANYYLYLLALQQSGEVVSIKRQPRYMLQEKFRKQGKTIRAIKYVADFEVTYADGRIEVIDTKGVRTPEYKIKNKLFEHKYPDKTIREIELEEIPRSK